MDDRNYKMPTTNTELKNSNLKRIFFEIQASAPIQRREIERRLGLSWGNVSLNIGTLLELGLVMETADNSTAVGRRPQCLDINTDNHYIIGVDIQTTAIHATVCDLKGRTIHRCVRNLTYTDRDSVLKDVFAAIDDMIAKINDRHIVGIGIAVQGIVNKSNTTSNLFPGFSNWERVNLKEITEERYHIVTYVFHDPDALMWAHKQFHLAREPHIRNAALIRLSNGVGLSIMMNGELFTSATGKSGEIGHINVERDGLLCTCGDRGCLEPYVTESGLLNRFRNEKDGELPTTVDYENGVPITLQTLATAAKSGDALCRRLFRDMGEYLGVGISNYINIFNPQLIIIEGETIRYRSAFEDVMLESVERHVWKYNETSIRFASYDPYYAAVGASLASLEKTILLTADFETVFHDRNTQAG